MAAKLQNGEGLVDDETRRREARQQQSVRFAQQRLGVNVGAVSFFPDAGQRRIRGMDDRHAGTAMMGGQSAVHPQAFVDLLEQVRGRRDALRGPKDQHALGAKGIVEGPQHALLCHTIQINEQISAADEVQPREWRIVCHVLPREEAQIANVLGNAMLAVLLVKNRWRRSDDTSCRA